LQCVDLKEIYAIIQKKSKNIFILKEYPYTCIDLKEQVDKNKPAVLLSCALLRYKAVPHLREEHFFTTGIVQKKAAKFNSQPCARRLRAVIRGEYAFCIICLP